MVKSPKEEFMELVMSVAKAKGADELTSRIIAALFIEPKEISLEDLSKRTGYSLSAVSTSMKLIEKTPFVKRTKVPGSKKVYFYMEKDLFGIFMRHIKMENELALKPMIDRLPEIIKRYRKENYPKEELKILEMHYNNVLIFSDLMKKMVEYAESRH
ncbi:MAG: hypothetical protein V1906_03885 [Candidatus Woesearchaeota archaeon]